MKAFLKAAIKRLPVRIFLFVTSPVWLVPVLIGGLFYVLWVDFSDDLRRWSNT